MASVSKQTKRQNSFPKKNHQKNPTTNEHCASVACVAKYYGKYSETQCIIFKNAPQYASQMYSNSFSSGSV